jgi:hypothetical protein
MCYTDEETVRIHPYSRNLVDCFRESASVYRFTLVQVDEKPAFLQHRTLIDKWTTCRLHGQVTRTVFSVSDHLRAACEVGQVTFVFAERIFASRPREQTARAHLAHSAALTEICNVQRSDLIVTISSSVELHRYERLRKYASANVFERCPDYRSRPNDPLLHRCVLSPGWDCDSRIA